MEHLPPNASIESASAAILETQKMYLEQRRADLTATLADVANKLADIDAQITNPEALRTKLMIELEWYCYDIDTYVSGYVPDSRYPAMTYEIDTHDTLTAWLGLLATQPKALAELPFLSKDAKELSTYVSSSAIGDGRDATGSATRHVFAAARSGALTRVQELLVEIKYENPYRDIPIPINEAALHDALVRQRILHDCLEHDPLFAIRKV